MGEKELKMALQNQGEEHIRVCWEESERLVAKHRRTIEEELSRLQEEADRQLQLRMTELRSNLLLESETKARECRLQAEAKLDQRLLALARKMLFKIMLTDRAQSWQSFCRELPPGDWQTVHVCTKDWERARESFPAAEVTINDDLGGGLIVATAGGLVQVDNSLLCRLQRAWPDLLPDILAELRAMVDNDETAGSDTSS